MTKLPSIESSDLRNVMGGKGLIEGGRKLLQAGAVVWNTLNPTAAPIKPPPSLPRIERVRPNPAGQRQGGGGGGGGAQE